MAKDLNKVMFTGRLGTDPELRYTPQGAAVCNLRVASNRDYTDGGERHEATEWFRVVVWEALAEHVGKWLAKGDRVYVEGRLQTRKWSKPEGQTNYTTEVIASDVIFLQVARYEAQPEPTYEPPGEPTSPPARVAQEHRPPADGPRVAVNHSPGARAARAARERAAQAPRTPPAPFPDEDLPL